MSMKKILCGVAALPLFAGVAFAQSPASPSDSLHAKLVGSDVSMKKPIQLTERQLDGVTAGWSFTELDRSNTSITWVSVYAPVASAIVDGCDTCYLDLRSPALNIASAMLGGVAVNQP